MGEATTTITVELSVVGVKSSKARDVWLHKDLGELDKYITAQMHSYNIVMLRLTPFQLNKSVM